MIEDEYIHRKNAKTLGKANLRAISGCIDGLEHLIEYSETVDWYLVLEMKKKSIRKALILLNDYVDLDIEEVHLLLGEYLSAAIYDNFVMNFFPEMIDDAMGELDAEILACSKNPKFLRSLNSAINLFKSNCIYNIEMFHLDRLVKLFRPKQSTP